MSREEKRVIERARSLWEKAGRPAAGPDDYLDHARELVAIEEYEKDTLKPTGARRQENVEDDPVASGDLIGPEGEPVPRRRGQKT